MAEMTRRQVLQWSARLAALMGLETSALPQIAEALEDFASGTAPVVWLQGLSCSGCSVSMINTEAPSAFELLTTYISLSFHGTLSATTGHMAHDVVNGMIERGDFYLAVEGSVPAGLPEACMFASEPVSEQIVRAARRAKAVISVGACASFGGIPAAEGNPTGAQSVPQFLADEHIDVPVIRVPGCPAHPDWIVGTLVYAIKFGMPALDNMQRPRMFYDRLVHDQCPRFADYERERFARTFSDEGCLFKLGCLGPVTHADCTLRQWSGGTNYCIKAVAPCIGCASHDFAAQRTFPFYTPDRPREQEESTV
jgi:hydrogenase small subunit